MKKTDVVRWISVWMLAWACLWTSVSTSGATATAVTAPRLDMVTALQAVGPHASLGARAKLFDRLVGIWDVEYTDFEKDGKVTHRSGEFSVGWVMGGRAIQDFWVIYPSGKRQEREVYTDLRYYNPKSDMWLSTFIDPKHFSVAIFTGAAVGDDRIVLGTQSFDGADTRWSINDIRSDSFVWREERSLDGGKTWRLLGEDYMKRRVAAHLQP
jgi:hypothetical protein